MSKQVFESNMLEHFEFPSFGMHTTIKSYFMAKQQHFVWSETRMNRFPLCNRSRTNHL